MFCEGALWIGTNQSASSTVKNGVRLCSLFVPAFLLKESGFENQTEKEADMNEMVIDLRLIIPCRPAVAGFPRG